MSGEETPDPKASIASLLRAAADMIERGDIDASDCWVTVAIAKPPGRPVSRAIAYGGPEQPTAPNCLKVEIFHEVAAIEDFASCRVPLRQAVAGGSALKSP